LPRGIIYRGRLAERGEVGDIFDNPQSDYTRLLPDAMPDPDPDRSPLRRSA
jgi:ABC-type oligopeptide transport system ATPase subunit